MTLNQFVRSVNKVNRQVARSAEKQRRELEKQRKQFEKLQEQEQNELEVREFENRIELLMSVHKEVSDSIDWDRLANLPEPPKPQLSNENREREQDNFESFKPSFFDKLLKRTEKKLDSLTQKIKEAEQKDQENYENALNMHSKNLAEQKSYIELAEGVLDGRPTSYIQAIEQLKPFEDLDYLGSSLKFTVLDKKSFEVELKVNSDEVIPPEIKSLTKTKKVSVKKMPISKFNDYYQDYVCGCALRIGRELFALLPLEMVIVHAVGDILDSSTGKFIEEPILSVGLFNETFESLNFDSIDPSDSMQNFKHNMKFTKAKGFSPIKSLLKSDFEAAKKKKVAGKRNSG